MLTQQSRATFALRKRTPDVGTRLRLDRKYLGVRRAGKQKLKQSANLVWIVVF